MNLMEAAFILENGSTARFRTLETENENVLILKPSHYLVAASICLEHHGMQTLHALLETGTGPKMIRSDMLLLT